MSTNVKKYCEELVGKTRDEIEALFQSKNIEAQNNISGQVQRLAQDVKSEVAQMSNQLADILDSPLFKPNNEEDEDDTEDDEDDGNGVDPTDAYKIYKILKELLKKLWDLMKNGTNGTVPALPSPGLPAPTAPLLLGGLSDPTVRPAIAKVKENLDDLQNLCDAISTCCEMSNAKLNYVIEEVNSSGNLAKLNATLGSQT